MQGTPIQIITWLYSQDRNKKFDIMEHKEKRSLNANSYLWVLCTEIADVIRSSKNQVYLEMLFHYGQSFMISIKSNIDISKTDIKYYDLVGTSKLNGKEFNHYRIYRGSSGYNSKEMAILLDGVVQEARNLGIKTKEDMEIERLVKKWGK